MVKKLTAIGNSLGFIIDRPILELLDIDKNTELEIKTDGEGLFIRPLKRRSNNRIKQSVQKMMDIHDATLKKLAQ
jgi:antitoxin MazE